MENLTQLPSDRPYVNAQGMEMREHGTALFPAGFYYHNLNLDTVPWHWHDELEAVVVAQGETLVRAGGQRHVLRAGQGLFINADVLHGCWEIQDGQCIYRSIVFHPRLVGGSVESVFTQRYINPLIHCRTLRCLPLNGSEDWHAEATEAIEQAWRAGVQKPAGYEFTVRALLSRLVFLVTRHLPQDEAPISAKQKRNSERIRTMLRFIEERFDDPLTIAEIAASAALSESECLRCFRSTIGTPPIQYLKQFRVQRAAELLADTQAHVGDIAAQCGFQDVSYFTRAFREMKGMTPGEYRRRKNGQERGEG